MAENHRFGASRPVRRVRGIRLAGAPELRGSPGRAGQVGLCDGLVRYRHAPGRECVPPPVEESFQAVSGGTVTATNDRTVGIYEPRLPEWGWVILATFAPIPVKIVGR